MKNVVLVVLILATLAAAPGHVLGVRLQRMGRWA